MQTIAWLKNLLRNARVIKYGIVGCSGIVVNLTIIALLFKLTSQKTWIASAAANVMSSFGNFVFHNLWTFSDRQHRGFRLIRGFLSYGFTSVLGICITTAAFAGFTQIATHLTTNSHSRSLVVVLACQFVAVLLGAFACYVLNVKYTWAEAKPVASADLARPEADVLAD